MKQRIITSIGLAVLVGVSLVTPALAVVSMSWTTIGNVNNLADSTGYGAVDHAYKIGTYEVTNAQYVDFLNAKGASNSGGISTAPLRPTRSIPTARTRLVGRTPITTEVAPYHQPTSVLACRVHTAPMARAATLGSGTTLSSPAHHAGCVAAPGPTAATF